jgi:hypothetical protein
MQTNKVPWTKLFPGLDHYSDITRDSVLRQNGERHYRVKLRLKHAELARVQRLLEPYGFTCEPWHAGYVAPGTLVISHRFECIKCIRHG